ncbi:hypothetical protein [Polynucleobacter ibericus]|uniref:hypothetical protein n=1 Tax=Polynucleobacter ibericus TaxID=1819725 RepID=UPI001BFE4488|nr:hypothetical protein [Polynucleobacter ibericus]QWE08172.1 hypothetical protein AOC20_07015 [Polynucleobacter ibericus]
MPEIKYFAWVKVSYKKLLCISFFMFIAGCQNAPVIVPPIKNPGGDVSLIFSRENKVLAGRENARVYVDDIEVCTIPNGDSCQINISSGTHALKVDNPWSYSFGMFLKSYAFSSGKTYRFMIVPNSTDILLNIADTGNLIYYEANRTAATSDNGDFTMRLSGE